MALNGAPARAVGNAVAAAVHRATPPDGYARVPEGRAGSVVSVVRTACQAFAQNLHFVVLPSDSLVFHFVVVDIIRIQLFRSSRHQGR